MLLNTGLARAAAAGRIRRNTRVGIRFPSTMATEPAWRAGHRAAVVPGVVWTGILLALDVVVLAIQGLRVPSGLLTPGLVVVLLVAIAWIAVVSDRAARASDRRTEKPRRVR